MSKPASLLSHGWAFWLVPRAQVSTKACAGPLETLDTSKLCPVGHIDIHRVKDGVVLYGKEKQGQEAPQDGVRGRNLQAVCPRCQHFGVGIVQGSRHSGRESSGEVGVGCHVEEAQGNLDLLPGPVGRCYKVLVPGLTQS